MAYSMYTVFMLTDAFVLPIKPPKISELSMDMLTSVFETVICCML